MENNQLDHSTNTSSNEWLLYATVILKLNFTEAYTSLIRKTYMKIAKHVQAPPPKKNNNNNNIFTLLEEFGYKMLSCAQNIYWELIFLAK